jgi:uncharacterized protein
MRPSTYLKPPGIHAAPNEPIRRALVEADTRIAGFVGVAERGPIHVPRAISSWEEFLSLYGYEEEHYLSASVEAFFRNGGQQCVVVRTAHLPGPGGERGEAHASCAGRVVLDGWKKPCFKVVASSEGVWGNEIWVSFRHATGARALRTQDLEVGAGEASVSTTRGFEPGVLVRIFDRESSDYVILTEVVDRVIRWGVDTPVARLHRASSPTQIEVLEVELHVAMRERREVFKRLQMHPRSRRYAPRVVARESRLVRLEDLGSSSPAPHNRVHPEPPSRLADGRDGSEALTPEDLVGVDRGPGERTGLMALAAQDEVSLLAVPDAMLFIDRQPGPQGELAAQRVQDVMVDLCENLKDRFAILDGPPTRQLDRVLRWRRRTDSSYGAYYWPWLGMPARGGAVRRLPPSGIMAGVYARCDTHFGVHRAPANVPVLGAVDLSVRVTEDDLGMLNHEGINAFRVVRGIRPWGARTASSVPDWRHINVRRLFVMLRRALDAGMAWATFEPNDAGTWTALRNSVGDFLGELHARGMFAPGKADDAYFVRCDAETNPPENVAKGLLTCEVGVAPAVPTEFMMVSVVQRMNTDS